MKKIYFVVLGIVFGLSIFGCGRSENSTTRLTNTSYKPKGGGSVDFKIIAKNNTLLDKEGNYKDSGHYSILYQAKEAKSGVPISGLDHDEFYTMYENSRQIDESVFRVSQDRKTVTNKILLLLDFSGSIVSDCDKADANTNPSNLCYQIVSSSQKFIDTIVSKNQTMAIYYFNSKRKPIPLSDNADPTDDISKLKSSLENLYDSSWRDENLKGFNSTNLYGAIKVAADEVVCRWFQDCIPGKRSELTDAAKNNDFDFATLVVFTDGKHTVGNNISESELLNDLGLYKRNYYYTIGLGKNVDDSVLKKIGKDGYLKADQTDRLNEQFDSLGERLNSFANSFYRIDYCPAQQSGVLGLKFDMHDKQRGYHGVIEDRVRLLDDIDFRCDL